uniref:L1 transposable element RRM domain-containing protein n=1 Tax=Equus caballus TaxID=9796 RepID=A0A9L0SHU0_HORSE
MEERISNLEDRNIEMLQAEEERELRLKRNEETLRELSDAIRRGNLRIIGTSEGEEREKGAESLFKEIMAENFPNLGREMELHVTEANRSPNFINASRPTPRHISRRTTTESSSSPSEQTKPWDEKQRKLKRTGKQDIKWQR